MDHPAIHTFGNQAMITENIPAYFIGDARVDGTLRRLYADALSVDPTMRQAANAEGFAEGIPGFYAAMKNAYMPVTPDLGMTLHMLLRAIGARAVVEFGTSFGISAVWMAAALRECGDGCLLTTEMDGDKAHRASHNVADAGLSEQVSILAGPAERTLHERCPDVVDFLFLDGAKSAYLPVLQLVERSLRSGALIVADNTDMPDARPFLDYVRQPGNGYRSANLTTEALGAVHPFQVLMRVT